MAVRNKRDKLVNFRLSEEELKALLDVCETCGARSFSDFVRTLVLRSASSRQVDDVLSAQLALIDQKLATMDAKISKLGMAAGESVSLRTLSAAIGQ